MAFFLSNMKSVLTRLREGAAVSRSMPAGKTSSDSSRQPLRRPLPFFPVVVIMGILLGFLLVRLFLNAPPGFLLPEDKRFERFTQEVFCSEMNGNTLNLHYTLANPEAFGVGTSEVSLGNASLTARRQAVASLENYLDLLDDFDYEDLSPENQLTCTVFRDYLETELSAAGFLLYDEPLSPALGVQAQLPILLAEYAFRTKGDVEDYLTLLTQIPDYFSSILSFERSKIEAGLFMSRECAAEVVSQCEEFISDPQNNYLITIFNEKIDEITNLTADEKIAYKNRNQSILTGYVIPAYQELGTKIGSYAGSSRNSKGLYYLPDGKEYYRYLVKSTVGDNRSIEEIEEAVKVQMVADFTAIQKLASQSTTEQSDADQSLSAQDAAEQSGADQNLAAQDAAEQSGADQNLAAQDAAEQSGADQSLAVQNTAASAPAVMLEELREKITEDFPLLPDVACDVKYVHESLQKHLSPAFYLTPPIDDYRNNVIYINPDSNYDEIELFTTLAHEGYPGHLYQSVYWNATQPDLLRLILDTGGYTEGWATYVEMYSFGLWEENPKLAALYQKNRSFTLGLASLLDIGIHYRGYSLEDVTAFLEKLGFGADTAASMYRSILQAPANYLKYYVGYLNFRDLRDDVKQVQKESFSLKEYHRMVLEAGPMPFYILRQKLGYELTGSTKGLLRNQYSE